MSNEEPYLGVLADHCADYEYHAECCRNLDAEIERLQSSRNRAAHARQTAQERIGALMRQTNTSHYASRGGATYAVRDNLLLISGPPLEVPVPDHKPTTIPAEFVARVVHRAPCSKPPVRALSEDWNLPDTETA